MKRFFFVAGLCLALAARVSPQDGLHRFPGWLPRIDWDLLWTGSREENGNLHNRGDFRLDLADPGLSLRTQVLDRRSLDPEADFSQRTGGGVSLGLYHGATGSRLLHGVLHERGLPSRLRNPWARSVPYAETRRPTGADLRTTSSATRLPEAYLRLSGPRVALFQGGPLPDLSLLGFASAQVASRGNPWPAFSGGLDAFVGQGRVSLEGFFTGTRLDARESPGWFGDPPSLPDREFRLWAASIGIDAPRFLFASDLALSSTFAYGNGFYGNAAIRLRRPLPGSTATRAATGPWSLSLALEGMGDRYVDRDGVIRGGGLRTAGRIERREPRGGLLRLDTALRAPAVGDPFNRSSSGLSYRFPTPSAREPVAPLRLTRVSLSLTRDASNPDRIRDGVDGTLGLSLNLPSVSPPRANPLGISLSCALRGLDSSSGAPSPYPFASGFGEFESLRIGCELRWSPGIFQFGTRLYYEWQSGGDGGLDGSVSLALRLRRGRFAVRLSWPGEPSYTLSWRLEI